MDEVEVKVTMCDAVIRRRDGRGPVYNVSRGYSSDGRLGYVLERTDLMGTCHWSKSRTECISAARRLLEVI